VLLTGIKKSGKGPPQNLESLLSLLIMVFKKRYQLSVMAYLIEYCVSSVLINTIVYEQRSPLVIFRGRYSISCGGGSYILIGS
jgi:hypothetical protein